MNTEMTIRKIPVSALKPAKYNPRKDLKPGDPAYEKIKRSLHDFRIPAVAEQYEGLENRLKGWKQRARGSKMHARRPVS